MAHRSAKPSIDLGLAVISAVSKPGHQCTTGEIAEVCGCTHQRIRQIERAALRKMRHALARKDPA